MLSIDPVDRLSSTKTSSPRCNSVSARWEPTKPAPPVISTRNVDLLVSRGFAARGLAIRFYRSDPAFQPGFLQPRTANREPANPRTAASDSPYCRIVADVMGKLRTAATT